ncbi:MAG: hypothetical protein ACRESF_11525 [Pseudomonas sp.]
MSYPTTTLAALSTLFAGGGTLGTDFAGSGGLWVGGVPEDKDVSLPLAVLVHHDEKPEWNFESATVQETTDFDLVIYAIGLAVAEGLANNVKAVFDPSSNNSKGDFVQLTMTGVNAAWLERQSYRIRLVDYRAADSSWVYEITLPYKAFVVRNI